MDAVGAAHRVLPDGNVHPESAEAVSDGCYADGKSNNGAGSLPTTGYGRA